MKNNTHYNFTTWKLEKVRKTSVGWVCDVREITEQHPNGEYFTSVFGNTEQECKERAELIASAPDLLKENQELKARIEELENEIKVLQQFDER